MKRTWSKTLASVTASGILAACGTWVGNPKGKDDKNPGNPPPVGSGPNGGASGLIAASGEVFLQTVRLVAGQDVNLQYVLSQGSSLAANDVDKAGPIEMSIVRKDGREVVYDRTGVSEAGVGFTPDEDGDYVVVLKNNTSTPATMSSVSVTGGEATSNAELASARTNAPHSKILLKAVIALSRNCTQNLPAPTGEYYVQPFVFLGKVGDDKKVEPLSSATISIKAGDTEIVLKKLSEFDVALYRERSDMTDAENVAFTRTFYQGYFGAAGEMYTVDTFRSGTNCAAAKTLKLGSDPGAADITLRVVDASVSPALDASFPVRATLSTAFSMYTASDQKLSDFTQCTYNRITGAPTTYNGDASACKTFSLQDPPYVTLDYKLPSQMGAGTAASDPTRILFYGHSYPKAWYQALIDNRDALASGAMKSVDLPGCLNNGGLVAVKVAADKTYLPLAEFNSQKDDIVNLARRTGSYTALTDFYQGNIDASGSLSFPTCIPSATETCAAFKHLTVNLQSCSLKADSGISVTSVSDSFIYPSSFEMSGIIAD